MFTNFNKALGEVMADVCRKKADEYYESAQAVADMPDDSLTGSMANIHKSLGDIFMAVAKEFVKNGH